jgi:hypothetical protein
MQKVIKFMLMVYLCLMALFLFYGLIVSSMRKVFDNDQSCFSELVCTFNDYNSAIELFAPDEYYRPSYLDSLKETLSYSWFNDAGFGFIPYQIAYAGGAVVGGAYRTSWLLYHYDDTKNKSWSELVDNKRESWQPQGLLFFPHYQNLIFYEHGLYYDYYNEAGSFASFYFLFEGGQFYQKNDAGDLGQVIKQYNFENIDNAIGSPPISPEPVRWKILYNGITILEHITEVEPLGEGVYHLQTVHGHSYQIDLLAEELKLLRMG